MKKIGHNLLGSWRKMENSSVYFKNNAANMLDKTE